MPGNELVSLRTAAEWFPRKGGRTTSAKSLENWIENGVKGLKLQAVRSGGEWFTSREWVEEFLRARG